VWRRRWTVVTLGGPLEDEASAGARRHLSVQGGWEPLDPDDAEAGGGPS
jgi:hypothetical protein